MNYDKSIISKVEKVFPLKGREDFFKYVIKESNGELAKNFEGNIMYFDPHQEAQAQAVAKARNKVRQIN